MEIEKCASGCASRGHYVVAAHRASSEAVHGADIPSEADAPSPPLARRMASLKQVSSGCAGGREASGETAARGSSEDVERPWAGISSKAPWFSARLRRTSR